MARNHLKEKKTELSYYLIIITGTNFKAHSQDSESAKDANGMCD